MASTPIFKPLSMADAYLSSTLLPTTLKSSPYPFLSLPSKPIKFLHLSSFASPSWVSLKKKPSSSALVPLVASTSDWAQQEEENQVQQEEEEFKWENQEGEEDGTEARLSDWEGEGEEGEEERTEGSGGEDGLFEEGGEKGGQEEEEAELSEDAKLFVGNLPYDVDSEILAQLFDQAGVVEVAEVIYSRQTDQSRGFGFVTMSSVEEAEKAVEMLHRFDMDGRSLTVNKAAPRGASPERTPRAFGPSFRIYVGNLPWQVDETRLEQVFSEHGKVLEAKVIYDKETGRSRGFGFVAMSSQTELDDAIAALDGQSLDGRALKVNVAEERPRRGSF